MGKLLTLKTATPANRAALIDEYGDVAKLRAAFAPTEKRHTQLREEIKSWYEDSAAEAVFTEKGTRYQLDVSMCANETSININAVYRKLGIAKFLKIVSVTLKALAKFLTEPEIADLTSSARTGSRSFVATALVQAAPQPATAAMIPGQ